MLDNIENMVQDKEGIPPDRQYPSFVRKKLKGSQTFSRREFNLRLATHIPRTKGGRSLSHTCARSWPRLSLLVISTLLCTFTLQLSMMRTVIGIEVGNPTPVRVLKQKKKKVQKARKKVQKAKKKVKHKKTKKGSIQIGGEDDEEPKYQDWPNDIQDDGIESDRSYNLIIVPPTTVGKFIYHFTYLDSSTSGAPSKDGCELPGDGYAVWSEAVPAFCPEGTIDVASYLGNDALPVYNTGDCGFSRGTSDRNDIFTCARKASGKSYRGVNTYATDPNTGDSKWHYFVKIRVCAPEGVICLPHGRPIIKRDVLYNLQLDNDQHLGTRQEDYLLDKHQHIWKLPNDRDGDPRAQWRLIMHESDTSIMKLQNRGNGQFMYSSNMAINDKDNKQHRVARLSTSQSAFNIRIIDGVCDAQGYLRLNEGGGQFQTSHYLGGSDRVSFDNPVKTEVMERKETQCCCGWGYPTSCSDFGTDFKTVSSHQCSWASGYWFKCERWHSTTPSQANKTPLKIMIREVRKHVQIDWYPMRSTQADSDPLQLSTYSSKLISGSFLAGKAKDIYESCLGNDETAICRKAKQKLVEYGNWMLGNEYPDTLRRQVSSRGLSRSNSRLMSQSFGMASLIPVVGIAAALVGAWFDAEADKGVQEAINNLRIDMETRHQVLMDRITDEIAQIPVSAASSALKANMLTPLDRMNVTRSYLYDKLDSKGNLTYTRITDAIDRTKDMFFDHLTIMNELRLSDDFYGNRARYKQGAIPLMIQGLSDLVAMYIDFLAFSGFIERTRYEAHLRVDPVANIKTCDNMSNELSMKAGAFDDNKEQIKIWQDNIVATYMQRIHRKVAGSECADYVSGTCYEFPDGSFVCEPGYCRSYRYSYNLIDIHGESENNRLSSTSFDSNLLTEQIAAYQGMVKWTIENVGQYRTNEFNEEISGFRNEGFEQCELLFDDGVTNANRSERRAAYLLENIRSYTSPNPLVPPLDECMEDSKLLNLEDNLQKIKLV